MARQEHAHAVGAMRTPGRTTWASLGLDLVTLRVFAAAAEERSLAKAAEREHLAPSAVSRRIAELEGRAGVQLLRRHDRGVEPTTAGEALLSRLADLFALLERVVADLDAHAGGARGTVAVHANISSISGPLPGALSAFLAAHPGVRVTLEERTSVEILHAVQTGVAELGIYSGTVAAPEGLTALPWREDRLVALLPRGHPLAERGTLRLADLLPESFVGLQDPSALQRLYRREAEALGAALRERVLVASFDACGGSSRRASASRSCPPPPSTPTPPLRQRRSSRARSTSPGRRGHWRSACASPRGSPRPPACSCGTSPDRTPPRLAKLRSGLADPRRLPCRKTSGADRRRCAVWPRRERPSGGAQVRRQGQ